MTSFMGIFLNFSFGKSIDFSFVMHALSISFMIPYKDTTITMLVNPGKVPSEKTIFDSVGVIHKKTKTNILFNRNGDGAREYRWRSISWREI